MSGRAAGWLCHTCRNKWTADIDGRVQRQTGCPKCGPWSKRSRYTKRPTFAESQHPLLAQWDQSCRSNHAANSHLGSIVIRPQSHKKVSWKCKQCPDGHLHQWVASVQSRTKGSGRPQCLGKKVCKHNSLATKAPTIAAEWDYKANAELGTPHTVMSLSNRAAGWLCHDCGHSWTAAISHRVQKQTGCPSCGPKVNHSSHTRRPAFAESQHPVLTQWDHKRNAAQGNTSAMQLRATFPTTPQKEAASKSTGYAPTAQQGKSTVGQLRLDDVAASTHQDVLQWQSILQVQLAGGAVP